MQAYRAKISHALSADQVLEYQDGVLVVDEHGKIFNCGNYTEVAPTLPAHCQWHDCRGNLITPGFVDCHVHLPQLDCRNKTGYTLLDWLKNYIYPAEEKFSNPDFAAQIAQRFFDELLAHGITTAAVYSTVHFEATDVAFHIAEEKGLRVVLGQVLMDQNAPASLLKPTAQLLKETEQLISKWHRKNDRLYYAVTPRFALTCSDTILTAAGKLAQASGAYFQTHLAETLDEIAQAKALHSFEDYAAFYEDKHCLGTHSLFAHCIHLESHEWDRLAACQCKVAHCPTSNVFLQSGTMPIAELDKRNMSYGFGTDVGAGPTFAMQEVISCAQHVHPKKMMSDSKAFYLATLGGAQALSLSDKIGNFEKGKSADFIIFEHEKINSNVIKVFVNGTCVKT